MAPRVPIQPGSSCFDLSVAQVSPVRACMSDSVLTRYLLWAIRRTPRHLDCRAPYSERSANSFTSLPSYPNLPGEDTGPLSSRDTGKSTSYLPVICSGCQYCHVAATSTFAAAPCCSRHHLAQQTPSCKACGCPKSELIFIARRPRHSRSRGVHGQHQVWPSPCMATCCWLLLGARA